MNSSSISLPGGYRYFWYDEIDSTSLEAFRKRSEWPKGAEKQHFNSWFCAKRQTGGRGTKGNVWQSKDGNLYASLLTRTSCSPAKLIQISLLAALAAISAIEQVAGDGLHINDLCLKWPNDILLNGHKICGILVESRPSKLPGHFDIVIGTGINLSAHPSINSLFPAGNLRDNGWTCSLGQLFAALAQSTRDWFTIWRNGEGFETLRLAWLDHSCHIGHSITIKQGTTDYQGRFTTLSPEGALVLADENGQLKQFVSGHITAIDTSE